MNVILLLISNFVFSAPQSETPVVLENFRSLYQQREKLNSVELSLETKIDVHPSEMYAGAIISRTVRILDGLLREESRISWPNGKESLSCRILGASQVVNATYGTPIEITDFEPPRSFAFPVFDPRLLGLELASIEAVANMVFATSHDRVRENHEIEMLEESTTAIDGVQCTVFKYQAGGMVTIAFAPEYGNNIVHFEVDAVNENDREINYDAKYKNFDGIWFPSEIRFSISENGGEIHKERTSITHFDSSPQSTEQFEFSSLSSEYNGRLGLKNGIQPFTCNNGRLDTQGVELVDRTESSSFRFRWLILVLSAILLFAGLAFIFKKGSK